MLVSRVWLRWQLALCLVSAAVSVGPELKARARLMRDLSLNNGLHQRGLGKGIGEGEGDGGAGGRRRRRTLIDMSLAIRSMDFDMEAGMFKSVGQLVSHITQHNNNSIIIISNDSSNSSSKNKTTT